MKEAEIQFTSGRKIIVKDIIDYIESQDFDVLVTKDEEHITVFRNSVEYMIVKDIPKEDLVLKDPMTFTKDSFDHTCNTCAYKDRGYLDNPCNKCVSKSKWVEEVK